MNRNRRSLLALGAVALACRTGLAQEEGFPTRPIRLVVPFPPGGAVDIVGREVAKQLSDSLKQPVVIDNKPGASAIIGTELVAKAPADGYTLLMGSASALTINQSLYKSLPYDPAAFAAIGLVANTPGVLAVHPSLPAKNLGELIALARSKPGKLTYASSGNGNFQHLLAELFKSVTNTRIVHIPYRGSAPALVDAVGGQVDMIFDVVPSAAPLIRTGKLRAMAVSTAKRSEALPDVPTMAEAGVPGFDASSWYGLVAPRGTPPRVVEVLSNQVLRMTGRPDMKESLLKVGAAPVGLGAPEFRAFLASETARWAEIIRVNNIHMD